MRKILALAFITSVLGFLTSLLQSVLAQATQAGAPGGDPMIGAGLAIGLAGLGAGIGMGTASAAAIGAIAEKPEVFTKTLIFIVFIEAIAIYGLVIAFMILMGA